MLDSEPAQWTETVHSDDCTKGTAGLETGAEQLKIWDVPCGLIWTLYICHHDADPPHDLWAVTKEQHSFLFT